MAWTNCSSSSTSDLVFLFFAAPELASQVSKEHRNTRGAWVTWLSGNRLHHHPKADFWHLYNLTHRKIKQNQCQTIMFTADKWFGCILETHPKIQLDFWIPGQITISSLFEPFRPGCPKPLPPHIFGHLRVYIRLALWRTGNIAILHQLSVAFLHILKVGNLREIKNMNQMKAFPSTSN